MTNLCSKCGHRNNGTKKFCKKCGTTLAVASMPGASSIGAARSSVAPTQGVPMFANAGCGNCGAVLKANATFCKKCGFKMSSKPAVPMFANAGCGNCGAALKANATFCNKCGFKMPAASTAKGMFDGVFSRLKKGIGSIKLPKNSRSNNGRFNFGRRNMAIFGGSLAIVMVLAVGIFAFARGAGDFADFDIADLPMRPIVQQEYIGDGHLVRTLLRGDGQLYFNYNPHTLQIFPGAVIRGDTVFSDSFTLVETHRSPIRLSVGPNSVVVDNPNLTNVNAARDRLIEGNDAQVVREARFSMHTVERGESFSTALSAGVGVKGVGVDAGTERRRQENSTNMVVIVHEVFYTVNVEHPGSAGRFFTREMTREVLGDFAPVYISSVNYGRMGILTVSTNRSETEVRNTLSATIPIKAVQVSPSISTEHRQVLNDMQVEAHVIGGRSGLSMDEFFANFSAPPDFRGAVPLSFTLNRLHDNAPVEVLTILDEVVVGGDAFMFEIVFDTAIIRSQDPDTFEVLLSFDHVGVRDYERSDIVASNRRFDSNRNVVVLDNISSESNLVITVNRNYYTNYLLRGNSLIRMQPRNWTFRIMDVLEAGELSDGQFRHTLVHIVDHYVGIDAQLRNNLRSYEISFVITIRPLAGS